MSNTRLPDNVGSQEVALRLVLGGLMLFLPFLFSKGLWSNSFVFWATIIIGFVLVITAIFRNCSVYRLLDINTDNPENA